MYTYVRAMAKSIEEGSRWQALDLTQYSFQTLFSEYRSIYAVLTHPSLPAEIGFDLEQLRGALYFSPLTFPQYLATLGNQALTPMAKVPEINTRIVKYVDGFHAGYKIAPIHPSAALDAVMPASDKTWLHLSRANTDFELFYQSCLVSVNGLFHLIDYDINGIYVVDGMKSARIANQNQLGIYSFREIGTLSHHPIKPEMLSRVVPDVPLSTRCHVDLGIDLTNKTPMLVLGGYLHVLDNKSFHVVNDTTLSIDFLNLPLLERFYESRTLIDLSLPLSKSPTNPTQIATSELFSDDVLRAYLTLSQSFIVLLDAQDVFRSEIAVDEGNLPGLIVTHHPPQYPLVTGHGRMAEYWYTYEDGRYAINCVDNLTQQRVFRTTDVDQLPSVGDARIPGDRMRVGRSYFLHLGVDIAA